VFTTIYKNIEFVVPEKFNRKSLEDWFDGLADTDVKESIVKIRWCELKPREEYFKIFVLCKHPYKDESDALEQARLADDDDSISKALDSLLCRFFDWIHVNEMPDETSVEGRAADISWYPLGLPLLHLDDLPAQERAQFDMNLHASDSLWLVKVTTDSEDGFVKATVGTNIPFISAGILATGRVRFLREFPNDFPASDLERECLYDAIYERTADYVGLIRLAAHFGSHAPLVTKILDAAENFKRGNAGRLEEWRKEYERTHSDEVDILGIEPYMDNETYCTLDEACEVYRRSLITATKACEHELPEILNSFLGKLPVPESSFGPEPEADGEEWKKSS